MKTFLIIFFGIISIFAFGQKTVTLVLNFDESKLPENETFFMASEINKWSPNNADFEFRKKEGKYVLQFKYDGEYFLQYKITRGSWENVESNEEGFGIENRLAEIKKDTTIVVKINGWKDKIIRKHTINDNKRLVSDTINSKILNAKKSIWVYLPKNYFETKKSHPVIYMQDGETLFDRFYTEDGQEWQVDETSDLLNSNFIVVGISSSENRLAEYSPYPLDLFKDVKGKDYLDFLKKELIPYINQKYNTKKGSKNTTIAGSSLGALISLYGVLEHHDTFGNAGIFSIAQGWNAPKNEFLFEQIQKFAKSGKRKIFVYYGEKETETLPNFSNDIANNFLKFKNNKVKIRNNKNGMHQAKYWQEQFADFLKFLK